MKNILATATASLLTSLLLVPIAHSHETTRHHTERHHVSHRRTRRGGTGQTGQTIPSNAVKWGCSDAEALHIAGNPQRDPKITVYFERQHHTLARVPTTTGANRYQDKLSGWDLIVIPSKAMLMSDRVYTRLADECTATQPAPALLKTTATAK